MNIHKRRQTEGYSCAEVVQLCQQAVSGAAAWEQQCQQPATRGIGMGDFERAFGAIGMPALTHAEAMRYLKWKGHVAEL